MGSQLRKTGSVWEKKVGKNLEKTKGKNKEKILVKFDKYISQYYVKHVYLSLHKIIYPCTTDLIDKYAKTKNRFTLQYVRIYVISSNFARRYKFN